MTRPTYPELLACLRATTDLLEVAAFYVAAVCGTAQVFLAGIREARAMIRRAEAGA